MSYVMYVHVLLAFISGKVYKNMQITPPCVCDRMSCVLQLARPEGAMYLVTHFDLHAAVSLYDVASRIHFQKKTIIPTIDRPTDPCTSVSSSTHLYTVAALKGAKPPRRFKPSMRNKALGAWPLPT